MARTNSDDLLMEDDLAAAFLDGSDDIATTPKEATDEVVRENSEPVEDEWEDTDDFPGQLAVDVYETADKLVVKARTAGISKSDLDVKAYYLAEKMSRLQDGICKSVIGVSFRERLLCLFRYAKTKIALRQNLKMGF